ncbi:MAG: M3 family metallopeptidase [Pseudomonadales bacterium]|nr:M3 family metallopeptidase [Pseudomonadales bacterium]MCP5357780.1 M3 family metallopeptidase [Pseudomonadales bacterium]
MSSNPLLQFDQLPDFPAINAAHIEPAVTQVLSDNRERLAGLVADAKNRTSPDWSSLMAPLDEMEDRLSKVWSTVSHLNAVNNTAEIRDAYNKCQPLMTEYYTELGQNGELFACVQALEGRMNSLALSTAQRKVLKDYLLEFRLAGVDLEDAKKQKFAAIEAKLSSLSTKFSNNVLDATMAWSKRITDVAELSGIPEVSLQAAAELARNKGQEGYLLTLDAPCYIAVTTNADNRALREEIYTAYVTRASDQGGHDSRFDNTDVIVDILNCRAELSHLLGYDSFADVSVARKMAKSVTRVNEFLADLTALAVPAAKEEYQALADFAAAEYGIESLQAWDVAYYSEKLRKRSFDISQEELRPYFPLAKVQEGLFAIAARIYGIEIHRNPGMSRWNEHVEAFDIWRDDKCIARFYFDVFTREGKRSGAWMAECRSRRELPGGNIQTPVAYLVCNFAKGSGKTPALLSHNEVTTLFHEFGHGLHHMLTEQTHLRCSGINGVAWDAVELPSQLMENWCWDRDAIPLISAHYQTGEALPSTLLDKLLQAKNFQAGMKTVRQLEFAQFDFRLHQLAGPFNKSLVSRVMEEVRALTSVYRVPAFNRFENGFSHIFAGGYAAGYYSYKWAEVLSADVFSVFAATGVFNHETGQKFLHNILSQGGADEPLELFKAFMGREPMLESLLKQDGLLR